MIALPSSGSSCSAGMPVDFIYDCGSRLPTHAAVQGGERRGLCGVKPCIAPDTIPNPDGGLCPSCATQIERVDGRWRVRTSAPTLRAHRYTVERDDGPWDDDD